MSADKMTPRQMVDDFTGRAQHAHVEGAAVMATLAQAWALVELADAVRAHTPAAPAPAPKHREPKPHPTDPCWCEHPRREHYEGADFAPCRAKGCPCGDFHLAVSDG